MNQDVSFKLVTIQQLGGNYEILRIKREGTALSVPSKYDNFTFSHLTF